MSRIHQLTSIQKIPASLDAVWKFFSDPAKLSEITPSFLNFTVTREVFGQGIYAGQVMTYTVRPLLGIPLEWMTEITHVVPGERFVDEQRKGPYRLWHHQHHFKPVEGGIEMTDIVHYRLPFWPFGELAHGPIVRKKLEQIFHYRYKKITELFGPWPHASIHLQID